MISAMKMGFKESPPAYLSTFNKQLKQAQGVNFASGGSGILDTMVIIINIYLCVVIASSRNTLSRN